jgi:hypothetical protein
MTAGRRPLAPRILVALRQYDAMDAAAFVSHWWAGSKVELSEGAFQVHGIGRRRALRSGRIGRFE